jgi:TfoX/Sxy family transcriptional regulator of competence genes
MTGNAQRIRAMEMALRAALAEVRPDADLTVKSMFGGAGFWVNGRFFAAWFGGGLALKLPEDARRALVEVGGVQAVESRQYAEVPEAFLDDPALLAPWVAQSVDYALTARPKR